MGYVKFFGNVFPTLTQSLTVVKTFLQLKKKSCIFYLLGACEDPGILYLNHHKSVRQVGLFVM